MMMTMVHPQQLSTGDQPLMSNKLKRNMNVLLGLGIAEVSIGSMSMILSISTLIYQEAYCSSYQKCFHGGFTIAEGIWCGMWVVTGGSLGIISVKQRPPLCLLYLHMTFSITAILFVALMISVAVIFVIFTAHRSLVLVIVESLLAVLGLISMSLCITSAVFCRITALSLGNYGCCGCCFPGKNFGGGHDLFVANSQPITFVQPGVTPSSSLVVQEFAQPNYVITGKPIGEAATPSSAQQLPLPNNQKTVS